MSMVQINNTDNITKNQAQHQVDMMTLTKEIRDNVYDNASKELKEICSIFDKNIESATVRIFNRENMRFGFYYDGYYKKFFVQEQSTEREYEYFATSQNVRKSYLPQTVGRWDVERRNTPNIFNNPDKYTKLDRYGNKEYIVEDGDTSIETVRCLISIKNTIKKMNINPNSLNDVKNYYGGGGTNEALQDFTRILDEYQQQVVCGVNSRYNIYQDENGMFVSKENITKEQAIHQIDMMNMATKISTLISPNASSELNDIFNKFKTNIDNSKDRVFNLDNMRYGYANISDGYFGLTENPLEGCKFREAPNVVNEPSKYVRDKYTDKGKFDILYKSNFNDTKLATVKSVVDIKNFLNTILIDVKSPHEIKSKVDKKGMSEALMDFAKTLDEYQRNVVCGINAKYNIYKSPESNKFEFVEIPTLNFDRVLKNPKKVVKKKDQDLEL